MVWGRLAGHVHAGCEGDRGATISALELRGAHLVIANVKSLAAARVTVPGPHTARVVQIGRNQVMQLHPLGPAHPRASSAGLAKSFTRWLLWYPAAAAALFTGLYALLAGVALLAAPKAVLGLLFDVSTVAAGWIRLGGVLFATFGLQYLGAALLDWRLASSSSSSSLGVPDMPFRPASPHSPSPAEDEQQQQQQQQQQAGGAADAGDGHRSPLQSMGGSNSSSIDGGGGSRSPQLQPAATVAAARSMQGASSSSSSSSSSRSSSPPGDDHLPLQQQQQQQQHKQQQQRDAAATAAAAAAAVHNPPASWLYSSNGFYEASVWSRLVLAALFCGLVAVKQCGPGLLLLAALNVMGAFGMLGALKKQWMLHVMGDMPNEMLMMLL
uniref:Uncharacterized protein n=1 Tax=Tetradesmus obliquus TaxID=3088 RepID=A0A383V6C6_TETOB|eukprot:jgi/Sobl393_1/13727/SZX61157.1